MSSDEAWVLEYCGHLGKIDVEKPKEWVSVPESWFHITRNYTGPCVPLSLEEYIDRVNGRRIQMEHSTLSYRLRNTETEETIPIEALCS